MGLKKNFLSNLYITHVLIHLFHRRRGIFQMKKILFLYDIQSDVMKKEILFVNL